MTRRRFLPDAERTRRAAGLVFLAIGLALITVVGWAAMGARHINGTTLVFLGVPLALIAWGLHLALRQRVVLEVDLDQRTFTVMRNSSKSAAGPLDSLGPLAVRMRTHLSGSGDDKKTFTEYAVVAAAHSKIDLFVTNTPGKARQKMERLARAWRLPCQSEGGAVRAAETLDTPLHERLRGDREALAPMPLRPEWGVRIEPLTSGYALVSTHRSWAPLKQSAFILVVTLAVAGGGFKTGAVSMLRDTTGDLLEQILGALMGVVALVFLWMLWKGVRDTFFPGTVRITERGVSYRGRTMRFDRIEEVTTHLPIEIVGDRRSLSLAPSFCPTTAIATVGHELQRLIVEVGVRNG